MGILTEEMQFLVREQRLGFVATVCPDGTPNLSPKGTTAVWDEDHLAFADLASPQTIANLEHNSAVEINVVDPLVRKGFRFKGTGRIVTDRPTLDRMAALLGGASGPTEAGARSSEVIPIRHVVLVKVVRAEPLISPVYARGLTEDEVRARWVRYWEDRDRIRIRSPPAGRA